MASGFASLYHQRIVDTSRRSLPTIAVQEAVQTAPVVRSAALFTQYRAGPLSHRFFRFNDFPTLTLGSPNSPELMSLMDLTNFPPEHINYRLGPPEKSTMEAAPELRVATCVRLLSSSRTSGSWCPRASEGYRESDDDMVTHRGRRTQLRGFPFLYRPDSRPLPEVLACGTQPPARFGR